MAIACRPLFIPFSATYVPDRFERLLVRRERGAFLELDGPFFGQEMRRGHGLLHVEPQSTTPTMLCATKPMMRVPPGEPTSETQPSSLVEQHRRRHARQWALAALDAVRHGAPPTVGT